MTQAQIDANQELEELKQVWLDQAHEDSDKITKLIAAYELAPADHPQFPDEIYRLFHDMQGQGGLFGYALMATLGGRLCSYWRGVNGVIGPQQLPVMRAFLVALRFILDRKLEGDGGQAGQAILAKLDALTQPQGGA
jgi:hypothetical protein